MTDDKIALRALLEMGSDATFLREMIGFAARQAKSGASVEGICRRKGLVAYPVRGHPPARRRLDA